MTNNDFKKYTKKYGANYALLTAETVEHIQIALNAGADVNAKYQISGKTALICEAGYGHTEIVKLLIEKGADVNAKTNNGCTPLIYAANNGHTEIVKLLIEKGADVNAKTNNGRTPLIFTANNGHTEIVKLLIEKGANVNAKDSNGKTVLDFAKTDEMKELLRKHGTLSIIQINEQIKKQKSAPAFQFKLSKTKKR